MGGNPFGPPAHHGEAINPKQISCSAGNRNHRVAALCTDTMAAHQLCKEAWRGLKIAGLGSNSDIEAPHDHAFCAFHRTWARMGAVNRGII